MTKLNCPLRFIVIVQHFHDGMLGKTDGGYSEPHDCVKAPTWYSMMFSDMLTDAFRTGLFSDMLTDAFRTGFTTKFCFDSKTVDLKRLIANLKLLQKNVLDKLLYENDLAEYAKIIK